MNPTKDNSVIPSEGPSAERVQALEEYKRKHSGKFVFVLDVHGHILIEKFLTTDTEEWQEFVIPDFVWGFAGYEYHLKPCSETFIVDHLLTVKPALNKSHKKLKISGGEGLRSAVDMCFKNFGDVTHLDFSQLVVKNITSANRMLYMCQQLLEVTGLEHWDISNCVDFSSMFQDCVNLVSISDLRGWKMENVTSLYLMFANCLSLKKISGMEAWSVDQVYSFRAMFFNCKNLCDIGDIGGWTPKSCFFLAELFFGCESLRAIGEIHGWNVSNLNSAPQSSVLTQPSIKAIFEGSSISFQHPEHILEAWTRQNPKMSEAFQAIFNPIIYPNPGVSKPIDIEKFMPDLGLRHEVFTWTTPNHKEITG